MLTRARTSSSTKEASAMAPTLADVMSELKSLKNVINVNADKAATKDDVGALKEFIEKHTSLPLSGACAI